MKFSSLKSNLILLFIQNIKISHCSIQEEGANAAAGAHDGITTEEALKSISRIEQ